MKDFALEVAKNAVKFSFEVPFKAVTSLPVFNFLASVFSDHSLKEKLENGLAIHQYLMLTSIVVVLESILFGELILKKIFVAEMGMSNLYFALMMIVFGALMAKLSNQIIKLTIPHYFALKVYLNSHNSV